MSGILWITGLAGSGKTSLANAVVRRWQGSALLHLDGDRWRQILGDLGAGYLPDQRLAIGSALARLSLELASQRQSVVVSTISRFAEVGEILATSELPVYRVLLQANLPTLTARRPHIHRPESASDHETPWPFQIDLCLRSDTQMDIDALAAQILAQWP